jgi:hypothetical protein
MPASAERTGRERQVQRVRIGLTGLGFVFVAVLLATALTGKPEDEAPVTANSAAPGANGQAAAPKEPLAELGVTPGHADNKAAPAANQTDSAFR